MWGKKGIHNFLPSQQWTFDIFLWRKDQWTCCHWEQKIVIHLPSTPEARGVISGALRRDHVFLHDGKAASAAHVHVSGAVRSFWISNFVSASKRRRQSATKQRGRQAFPRFGAQLDWRHREEKTSILKHKCQYVAVILGLRSSDTKTLVTLV